jgi:hypothetical protein
MRILRVVVLAWILTDCGAALGWALGRPFGRQALFLGAIMLGTLAILLAIRLVSGFGWLNPDRRRGGSIGALCAFALAAPLAAMNLDSPVVPLLVMGFVGIGVILGAGPSAVQ